jgi:thiamine pyrophosphokinase
MHPKRALIFTNGSLEDWGAIRTIINPEDYLIAVDGGLAHLDRLGFRPHLLIGDMDSVEPSRLAQLDALQVEILRYPVDKNETDLELALQAAMGRGFNPILIIAATGGRLDQTLGNLALLASVPRSITVKLESGKEEIMLCHDRIQIEGQPGDIISLIAWGTPGKGVTTSGLKYPLKNETLFPEKTRGISNVMLHCKAGVKNTAGSLICIHTRGEK